LAAAGCRSGLAHSDPNAEIGKATPHRGSTASPRQVNADDMDRNSRSSPQGARRLREAFGKVKVGRESTLWAMRISCGELRFHGWVRFAQVISS
jgi:hypothetical protein